MNSWKKCLEKNEAKKIHIDTEIVSSLLKTSSNKLVSSDELKLREETAASKISLLYDSIRELLEAIAINNGFKIYNHVCYTFFLKEILDIPEIVKLIIKDVKEEDREYYKSLNSEMLERLVGQKVNQSYIKLA